MDAAAPWANGASSDAGTRALRGDVEAALASLEQHLHQGCTRIALTTLSVEAPGFYKKQGYDVAATIDCEPPGITRHYMLKKL